MSAGILTREMFKSFMERCMNEPPQIASPQIFCHPLEFPFYDALWGERQILELHKNDLVIRWLYECFRKYRMGEKTGDTRWTMAALIEQYTRRIEALR